MEKKNILKILLVSVAVIGLIYLIVVQFNKVGTNVGRIDYYDLMAEIGAEANDLSPEWDKSSYNDFRAVLSDIDVAKGMNGISEEEASELSAKTNDIFKSSAGSYFVHSSWTDYDLGHIKQLASYLRDKNIVDIIDGYYDAVRVIAASRTCATTTAVENCIAKANSYNKTPWTNCTDIKQGLSQVKTYAMESFISRSLLPICNRLSSYRTNYTFFDEFDADYQKVKDGKAFLDKNSYTNASFNSKFGAIPYNDAANVLDPRI